MAKVVLFVAGYAEPGGSDLLAHRFAHSLATGVQGEPVVLRPGEIQAVSPAALLDPSTRPGGADLARPMAGDERAFYAEAHQSLLESSPRLLVPPENPVLLDPHVYPLTDPDLGVLRAFLGPFWHYSTNANLRYAMQGSVKDALLRARGAALAVVAHGFGAVVLFDTLFKMGRDAPPLELVTTGAPLGLPAVQRRLKAKARPDAMYPIPAAIRRWTNVAAKADPVCADPTLADEFRWDDPAMRIEDRLEEVETGWPYHRWEGYAKTTAVRRSLGRFAKFG
jgi:hypothetical protein